MTPFGANERVLIIGLGRSGLASVAVLRERGAAVYATDEKPVGELQAAIAEIERDGARFIAPHELDALLPSLECAVLSPGVPLRGELARRVQAAQVPILGEVEVAFRLARAPIVAVTGTKGKSTVTALVGHLMRHSGNDVRVGGNIGNPLIREVLDVGPKGWVVAEVSSFQLETTRTFKPRVSVILNVQEDHLDRYDSMNDYTQAKYRIFANQDRDDVFVGNLDDPRLARLRHDDRLVARQLWFSLSATAGVAMSLRDGDALVYAPSAGEPIVVARSADIPIAGDHNVRNVMAALLAAIAAGSEPAGLREALRSFAPMAHRMQPVAERDGVTYVDDSKATNPAAVMAALGAYDRPIVLIAGGRSKGSDFTEMGRVIAERVKALILIGESADEIARYVPKTLVQRAAGLAEAVQRAASLAGPGDVVLLSPGCASFDMFESAEDRGERFVAAVRSMRVRARA